MITILDNAYKRLNELKKKHNKKFVRLSVKGGGVVVPFRKNPHKQLVLFRCSCLLFEPKEEEEVAIQRTLMMLLLIVFVER